jgi:hypothetical protein
MWEYLGISGDESNLVPGKMIEWTIEFNCLCWAFGNTVG